MSHSNTQLSPQEIISLYMKSVPNVLGATEAQMAPFATSMAQASAAANPIYTRSGLEQLQNYAPGYTQSGIDLSRQQAAGTAALMGNEGRDVVTAADQLNRLVNPEYYSTRTQLSNAANNLLNSYGPTDRLSGGEAAAAERAISMNNQATGNLGNTNAMNTITNAMNFGSALREKQNSLAGSLGSANSVLGNLQNSQFNPVATAQNAGNTSNNFALGTFSPSQGSAATGQATDFASSLLGNLSSSGSTTETDSHGWNAGCCFIFLEATDGKMPWYVRKCRDIFYRKQPDVATGYKKMARCLVPLMKRSKIIKSLVRVFMVKPITMYGGWLCDNNSYGWVFKPVKCVWFSIWSKIA